MHRLFRIKAYEAEHGPHFDEEMARKAVSKMENEEEWRALPNEGLFFLDVRQEVPTASADLPVTLKAEESTPDGTSMLRNALAEDVQAGDLKMTIRYMIYYNKCTKTYQLVNSYLANIPTATA